MTPAHPPAAGRHDSWADLLVRLLALLAVIDGNRSDAEFDRVFCYLRNFATPGELRRLIDLYAALSASDRVASTGELVQRLASEPAEKRLVAIAYLLDFAAVGDFLQTERDWIDDVATVSGVGCDDLAVLERIAAPGDAHRSARVSVVHFGPDGPDVFVALRTSGTVVRVGGRWFLRVATSGRHTDGSYLAAGVLTEIAAGGGVALSGDLLMMPDLQAITDAADAVWAPQGDPDAYVAEFRSGALIADRARFGGSVARNGCELVPGRLYVRRTGCDAGARHPVPEAAQRPVARGAMAGTDADDDGSPRLIALVANSVRAETSDGRVLLDDISVHIEAGTLVAVLGPSGCGKSTLLEALAGRRELSAGCVYGVTTAGVVPLASVRQRVGLVPQTDVLLPDLTVRENVALSLALRVSGERRARLEGRIDDIIARVGLHEAANRRVGTALQRILSGGERRRAALAQELVADPEILVLDEPLSGLSSRDASMLVDQLTDVSRRGTTIVAVVHQPSAEILSRFDCVLVLDVGGRLAFFGEPSQAISFFVEHARRTTAESAGSGGSPAALPDSPDVILQVLEKRAPFGTGDEDCADRLYPPDYWAALFRSARGRSMPSARPPASDTRLRGAARPEPARFPLAPAIRRHLLLRLRSRTGLALTLGVAPALGLLLGAALRTRGAGDEYALLTNPQFPTFLSLVPVVGLFLSVSGSCVEFVRERRLIRHEVATGVHPGVYVASKLVSLGLVHAIEILLFLGCAAGLLEFGASLPLIFAIAWLVGLAGVSMGLTISALAPTETAAYSIVPLLLIANLLFGGGLLRFEDMGVEVFLGSSDQRADGPWLSGLMPSRLGFEALAVSLAEHGAGCAPRLAAARATAAVERRWTGGNAPQPERLAELNSITASYRGVEYSTDESRALCDRVRAAESTSETDRRPVFLATRRQALGTQVSTVAVRCGAIAGLALAFVALTAAGLRRQAYATRPAQGRTFTSRSTSAEVTHAS